MSGLYSGKASLTAQELVEDAQKDPALTNALRDIAMIRVLLDRAHGLLEGEEAEFLAALEKAPLEDGEEAKMRDRLLSWYRHMIDGHAKKVQTIQQYFDALEKKASGVSYDAIRASMLAIVRVLAEKVPDDAQRNEILAALDEALDQVVAGMRADA